MAVKVVQARTGTFAVDAESTHDAATDVHVKDGHLVVTRWNGARDVTVAVYAPGKWTDAVITE